MQRSQPTARPGFTLVELLMVIVIIGVLASLLIVAVGPAIGTANNAVVKTEINQLNIALNNYRDTYGALPPTMLVGNADASVYDQTAKEKRFERHLRKAFPRFRSVYASIQTDLMTATEFPSGSNYGGVTSCKLNTLDAAESLVFWLGGIPKVWKADLTNGDYEVELTGFSSDPSNPLLPEYQPPAGGSFQSNRTDTLFQFDPKRLVDSDQDGWPEYVPDFGGTNDETPPYVYFDSGSYGVLPRYPYIGHPGISVAADNWGFALPYLIRYTPNSTDPEQYPLASNFANADSFQIICAGADYKYGHLNDLSFPSLFSALSQMIVYPRGEYYVRKSGDPSNASDWKSIDGEQYDNLTNFTESKLETEFGTSN